MREYNSDEIMGAMVSQITSVSIVYSTVYSGADQRKHQSSASLAFVRGIHRWPLNSPHKGPVTRKCFHLMKSPWYHGCKFNKMYISYILLLRFCAIQMFRLVVFNVLWHQRIQHAEIAPKRTSNPALKCQKSIIILAVMAYCRHICINWEQMWPIHIFY